MKYLFLLKVVSITNYNNKGFYIRKRYVFMKYLFLPKVVNITNYNALEGFYIYEVSEVEILYLFLPKVEILYSLYTFNLLPTYLLLIEHILHCMLQYTAQYTLYTMRYSTLL